MTRSMTAFSRWSAPSTDGKWAIEMRTINNRYFELSVKLPAHLANFESRARDLIHAQISRGKIFVSISDEGSYQAEADLDLDEAVVRRYLKGIKRLQKDFKLAGSVDISEIVKLPGIFHYEKPERDAEGDWKKITPFLKKALDQLIAAKKEEGKKLSHDMRERLDSVTKALTEIEKKSTAQPAAHMERLRKRMKELLGEMPLDEERIYREAAFLAEKSDITEEIVRLRSHLDVFRKKLQADQEIGRELDFISQEMNREINTIGSKSQHFEIAQEVVFVKGELEKIREQAQNIE